MKLFRAVEEYLSKEGLTRADFATQLGVSKGRVSQILNGDFNGRLDRLVELALASGKAPVLEFRDLDEYVEEYRLAEEKAVNRRQAMATMTYRQAITVDELTGTVESAHGVSFQPEAYRTMVTYRTSRQRTQQQPIANNRQAHA